MPSTQENTNIRSAHKESDIIGINDDYYLSDYAFRIERKSVASSTYDQITAVCTNKDGKNARQAIQIPSSTKLESWYVEANETVATVYAVLEIPEGDGHSADLDTSPVNQPIFTGNHAVWNPDWEPSEGGAGKFEYSADLLATFRDTSKPYGSGSGNRVVAASSEPGKTITAIRTFGNPSEVQIYDYPLNSTYTYNEKTVYYHPVSHNTYYEFDVIMNSYVGNNNFPTDKVAWVMVYGTPVDPEYEEKTVLVGRFAIDIKDAGGDGPGSDWDDPGDWNEDWEEGDPTQTLHVEVIGALSGRHNDPIEDPSYSYIPADKETVKGYGCGGDGGHGGGGGAGASTVVVYKFATNQADDKEIVALAKRHGYGSGGGKGGKGGDGCILVYY